MSILAVLSAIFVMLLNQVRTSTEGSGVRLDARAIHREVQSRLRILFKSALAPNEVDPSVAWPDIGNTDTLVRFHAPANLLDDTVAFDPRTPNYPEFSLGERGTRTPSYVIPRSSTTNYWTCFCQSISN